MTNARTTRRALLTSIMSLILCCTMLLSTTYAWFTDTVTSATNTIIAGNLDIELYHTDKAEPDGELVGDQTKLFDDITLWEPGAVVYETFKIENKGNLALKYQFSVNITNATENANGDTLAKVLKVGVIDGAVSSNERTDLINAVNNTWQDFASFTKSDKLVATNENDIYTVVIYWEPSDIDNDYNVDDTKPLKADISATLIATQLNAEEDSFDKNYDENAWGEVAEVPTPDENGVVNIYTAEQLAGVMGNTAGIKTINIIENINLIGRTWVPAFVSAPDLVINGNGHIISNMTTGGDNNVGFIGAAYQNITINDLTFKNAKVEATGSFVGGVIGNAWDHANITFNNVDLIDSEVSTTIPNKAIRVGGLIGYSPYTRGDLTLKDCDVSGSTITGYHNVGAMVGTMMFYGSEQGIITIENCTAKNNTLMYGSSQVGAFAFGASTSGYTEYVPAAGFTAENNKTVAIVNVNANLQTLINNGAAEIELPAGTYTFPASSLSENQTLICAPGTVFEGANLNANGATVVGATFSGTATSNTVNGIYKDCTFTGSNGLRYGYVGETAVFENCVFSGNTYGVHFDGGANEVLFKNCTISGFNATAAAVEKVTFEGCTFVGNGKSSYNGINLWGDGDFKNCTFVFDGSSTYEWIDLCSGNKTANFQGCVVTDGTTTSNVSTLIGDKLTKRENSGKIIVDGVELTY